MSGGLKLGNKTQQFEFAQVNIVGTAPILVARAMPWDSGGKFWEDQPTEIREAKNPADVLTPHDRQLLQALGFTVGNTLSDEANAYLRGHWLPDTTPGFPASGFMGACRTAVVQYKSKKKDALTAKKLGGAMHIMGDERDQTLVAIDGEVSVAPPEIGKPSGSMAPRVIVRLKLGLPWSATLIVRVTSQLLSIEDMAQVIAWAGDWGVGQWRPSSPKGGNHGTWRVHEVRVVAMPKQFDFEIVPKPKAKKK